MAEDRGSKTEQPTAKRLEKAREQGQVSKSMELNTCVVLLSALFTLFFTAAAMYHQMSDLMTHTLAHAAQITIEESAWTSFLTGKVIQMAVMMAPIMIVVPFMGVLSNLLQVGPLFTAHPLQPKLSKINPISGFSRMFSLKSLNELAKSILKITIIAATSYFVIRSEMDEIFLLGDMPPVRIGYFVMRVSFEIFLKTCWLLVFLAILDFAFQKWQYHRDMMMSKEEVKEELKQTEGDPLVKSRIRSTQREMARRRMMSEVPEADVVVTNPVHLAVALKYDPKQADAPVVVAKGRALMAEKIKSIAKEHDVPIIEDKPLAQALYKTVEVGEAIPMLFYQAIAEILSYVYRMKGKAVHG